MKTETYFQHFKTNLFFGIKIGAVPLFLINILLGLILSIGLVEATWDTTLIDGVYISLLVIIPFMLIAFLSVIFISLIISSKKKLSNITVFILGALIGAVLVVIGDYISLLFWLSYEFMSLPSIAIVILLAYVGQKMNRHANIDSETKVTEWELRAGLWMALIAFVSSVTFVLIYEDYLDILDIYIYLGYVLSISLPVAILAGFLIGFVAKKIPRPAFLNWTVWQRAGNTIRWAAAGIRKRIGNYPIPKIMAFIVLTFGVFSGIIYLRLTVPSEREIWRISDNSLSDPIILNELLLFEGYEGESPSGCEYIYAVDKNTGAAVWSSESLTDQYCDHSSGPVFTAIILLSEKKDVIFVSSSYWITDDDQNYVLYALSSTNGELLWKIDGYASYPYDGYYPLDYSPIDTNYIYIVNKEGSFSAIDNSTGKQVWKQEIPKVDYDENIFIEYYDQVVYYYNSGDNSLITFDARDGCQLWEVSNLDYVEQIMFSDQSVYLATSSYHDDGMKYPTVGHSPFHITALDTITGKQKWKLSIGGIFSPWAEIIGNKVYIMTHSQKGSFNDAKSLGSLVVVNKDTGELIWQFNEDYLHEDMKYLVDNDVVYVGANDGYQFALDGGTGKIIWQAKAPGFAYYLYAEDNTLVVVYEEKYASGFDTKTGKQKWILDVGMDTSWYPPDFIIAGDGVIYIAGAADQRLYAIDIETGKILWSWNHYHPGDKAYLLKALDNDVLYVDQDSSFFGYNWFFALKTKP